MFDIQNLLHFCAVIEEGSFRAAAERLHVSQPAVSQRIQALERSTGHVLLERKTCSPTPVGQRLYEQARDVLAHMRSIERELQDYGEEDAPALRIGTSDTMAIYVLPEVVKTFSERRPRTRLVLVNRHSGTVAQHVLRGDLDLGIVTWGSGAEPPDSEELEAQMLFQEQFVLAVPTGHSLAGRADVELEELRREALLQLDPQTRTGAVLRNIFASAELEERVVLDSGSFEVIKRYVEAGVGIALLPKTVMTRANAGLAVASVARIPPTCIGAIWRRGVYRSRGELEFLDLVRSAARGLAG